MGDSTGTGGGSSGGGGLARSSGVRVPDTASSLAGREVLASMLGRDRPLTNEEMAALTGAPPGSEVRVTRASLGGPVRLQVTGANGLRMDRTIAKDGRGRVYASNDLFTIDRSAQGSGIGQRAFRNQVDALTRAGASHINVYAAGNGNGNINSPASTGTYNGYYTWARFGYNAPLSRGHARDAAAAGVGRRGDGSAPTHISDLMKTPAGRNWWKAHGSGTNMVFDLNRNSLSQRTLKNYTRQRADANGATRTPRRAATQSAPRVASVRRANPNPAPARRAQTPQQAQEAAAIRLRIRNRAAELNNRPGQRTQSTTPTSNADRAAARRAATAASRRRLRETGGSSIRIS